MIRHTPVEHVVAVCKPLVGGRARAGVQEANTPTPYILIQESGVLTTETAAGPRVDARAIQVQVYTQTYTENATLRAAVLSALRRGRRLDGLQSAIDTPIVGADAEAGVTHRHIMTVIIGV